MNEYYAISTLDPLIEELVSARNAADRALERHEAAVKALAECWNALEEKRGQAFEADE
jgi:hypothetical protein